MAAHDNTPTVNPPKAPVPSSDPGVVPRIGSISLDVQDFSHDNFDVMTMDPVVALKLLGRAAQGIVEVTGDIPSTPALQERSTESPRELQRPNLTRIVSRPGTPASIIPPDEMTHSQPSHDMIGSPEAHHSEAPWSAADEIALREQRDAVARKFFSKKPPPIAIEDYLARMHRYCPMSTTVYLAACVYIHTLAIEDHSVPVTPRTVHRLVLACLRVAMKALEDLSYPHQRFAGVGGVSEKELAKLEIALCYLLDFQLRVNNEMLESKTRALLQLADQSPLSNPHFKLQMPPGRHVPTAEAPNEAPVVESKG